VKLKTELSIVLYKQNKFVESLSLIDSTKLDAKAVNDVYNSVVLEDVSLCSLSLIQDYGSEPH